MLVAVTLRCRCRTTSSLALLRGLWIPEGRASPYGRSLYSTSLGLLDELHGVYREPLRDVRGLLQRELPVHEIRRRGLACSVGVHEVFHGGRTQLLGTGSICVTLISRAGLTSTFFRALTSTEPNDDRILRPASLLLPSTFRGEKVKCV